MMHFARLRSSARLRRIHDLLRDGAEYSSLEITMRAMVCAVGTAISELRANGAEIDCRQEHRPEGGRIFLYRMTKPVPEAVDA